MTSDQPKVSFIPKETLIREEPFLERPRPKSLLGFLAVVSLFASVGAYAGLYLFNLTLKQDADAVLAKVEAAQAAFVQAPSIEEARLFQKRAQLAEELLGTHTVVTPVFKFLEENTLSSIYYTSFSFKKGEQGFTVELAGEAPSYASLAYQSDKLNNKSVELSEFSFSNITLTKFGSVGFNLKLVFTPEYLLYSRHLGTEYEGSNIPSPLSISTSSTAVSPASVAVGDQPVDTAVVPGATQTIVLPSVGDSTFVPSFDANVPVISESENPALSQSEVSSSGSFWSFFKFW